jgi:hypothetical protein
MRLPEATFAVTVIVTGTVVSGALAALLVLALVNSITAPANILTTFFMPCDFIFPSSSSERYICEVRS